MWEVARWVEDLAAEHRLGGHAGRRWVADPVDIEAALGYRADNEEIAARIELHRRETAAADAR